MPKFWISMSGTAWAGAGAENVSEGMPPVEASVPPGCAALSRTACFSFCGLGLGLACLGLTLTFGLGLGLGSAGFFLVTGGLTGVGVVSVVGGTGGGVGVGGGVGGVAWPPGG